MFWAFPLFLSRAAVRAAAAGFAPASVLGAPAMGFGAFEGAAALMGAQSVTSTGVPQNTNPLLAPSKTIHVGNLNAAVTPDVLRQIFSCIGSVVDERVTVMPMPLPSPSHRATATRVHFAPTNSE